MKPSDLSKDSSYPYLATGASVVRAVVSEEKDRFLATASLAELGKYIPDIDTAKNVDLLGIAFNIFVANRFNKNDDVSDSATSVALAKSFINKPINIEHNRQKVAGVVLNYAFTRFGSNEPMTEEEALASTDPFNVTLGGIIWRIVHPQLAQLIEECSDPSSADYEKISASWEVGFLDFAVAAVDGNSRNLADAQIITDKEEISKLKEYMKAFGGKGTKNDKKLYRLIQGEALPLGVGLTTSPAAEVLGVVTEVTIDQPENEDTSKNEKVEEAVATKTDNSTENISQIKESAVIEERKPLVMKVNITKLEDFTDDLLKQATASEVTEWVREQLRVADEAYKNEKNKLENDVKASKDVIEKMTADQAKLQEDLKKVSESLAALEAEKEARAKQDAFNTRMATLDASFELSDEEREVIAGDVLNLDDEAYAAYQKKLEVLLAAKKKSGKKCAATTTEAKASTPTENSQETVTAALENAEKDKAALPAAAAAQQPDTMAKFAKAFGVDQWTSDIKLV